MSIPISSLSNQIKSNRALEGFTAVYERGEQGWKVAACPEIPGVVSQGRTMEEA
jgi:hypothetical protein